MPPMTPPRTAASMGIKVKTPEEIAAWKEQNMAGGAKKKAAKKTSVKKTTAKKTVKRTVKKTATKKKAVRK